jgi:hypothetical protein
MARRSQPCSGTVKDFDHLFQPTQARRGQTKIEARRSVSAKPVSHRDELFAIQALLQRQTRYLKAKASAFEP